MASVECHKTCEESCQQQKRQHESLGQKVSELFKGNHHRHSNEGTQTHTTAQCYTQTEVLSQSSGHLVAKTETTQCTQTQGTSRRQHKRNLFQKIKDGLTGHSSDSSSESDSDNENCPNRPKASNFHKSYIQYCSVH